MTVTDNDKKVLRDLAKRFRENAELPVMAERKKIWKDLHDLKPQRPVIMFEPYFLDGYLADYTLQCSEGLARSVELYMMMRLRQFEEIKDDMIFEPHFNLAWQGYNMNSTGKDFGEIQIVDEKAKDGGLAYKSTFPVKTPADIKRMTPRTFRVEKEPVLKAQALLMDIFGDILPVKIGNFDNFDPDLGNQVFAGNFFIGVTWDLFKLIGSEAMMLWPYDEPDGLRELLAFLVDDKKRFFNYLVQEGLVCSNTDSQFAGPSCYGYVSDLPEKKTENVGLKDLWCWSESQETEMMGPDLFEEFYLPYMAELANMFGLSYYGCCEQVDHKLEKVFKAIHNIRIISISGWTDRNNAFEIMGNKYVGSVKPFPAYVSTPSADWDAVKEEAKKTCAAAKRNNTPIEVICRDVYGGACTPKRAVEWVQTWKQTLGI